MAAPSHAAATHTHAATNAHVNSTPAVAAASTSASSSSVATPPTASKSPKPADPNLDHLTSAAFEHIYEPAEDSFLLMDALYEDLCVRGWADRISGGGSGNSAADGGGGWKRCVELGPGSGIISAYLCALLRRRGSFLAIDINPHACRATRETLRRNRVRAADVVQGDLTAAIEKRMQGKVDILVFNPPYVPTPASEMQGEGISRSWAGGEKGREVLDKLLPRVGTLLAPRGVFYCVLLSSNEPAEVATILQREGGFSAETVLQRRAGREDLQIVRYWRPQRD